MDNIMREIFYKTSIIIINLLKNIVKILFNSPVYPHYLEFLNSKKQQQYIIDKLCGKVLEVGSGNVQFKKMSLKNNNNIENYIATDHISWDNLFYKQSKEAKRWGSIFSGLYGPLKDMTKLDVICDATELPFRDNTFDIHCSIEVLEHIEDVEKYFSEAYRVLKKGGLCIIQAPFLYRVHPNDKYDYQRILKGGYSFLARKYGFVLIDYKSMSFFGTTIASLFNQFLIRKILESKHYFIKMIFLIMSPIYFTFFNVFGYAIDLLDKDTRFATRFVIILKKI